MNDKFIADFETTERDNKMHVWLWNLYNIDTQKNITGTKLDDFMKQCEKLHNPIVYCHNLKYDRKLYIKLAL